MRAGNLDRKIIIQTPTRSVNHYGADVEVWGMVATMRAQLLQNSTDDNTGAAGSQTERTLVFRTRWLDGVKVGDRVTYIDGDDYYEIREIKELGRRRGLDLKCVRLGA